MEVNEYTAIVTKSEPGWSIFVPEVDRHTYAAHLREVEDMACDLVAVMTDQRVDDIRVSVQLPDDLAASIAAMRQARDAADRAETAARDAQRAAATTLRNSGAPLRDIAAIIGVSYQRVHQILEAAEVARNRQLDQFRHDIDVSLAYGPLAGFALPVIGDDGGESIVVALADELLSVLLGRLTAVGGYANVFVRDADGRVRFLAVVDESCAIGDADDDMTARDQRPGPSATVGAFVDWVQLCPGGVVISTIVDRPACATDPQTVQLATT